MAKKLMDKVLGFMGFEEETADEEERAQDEHSRDNDGFVAQPRRKGQVVNLHAQRQVKVIVAEPKVYDDVQNFADHLKNHRPVIINLEKADAELAKRVVDFISGATYALNGLMRKVGNGIFLFTPSNVDIASELKEEAREQDHNLFSWMRQV
ncbi:MAG: Cell division protein sepF [Desulfotomaculum sp. 46_296]|nr:MAG: Cell division protein sepF [Desulfotomaculum sp. 46_296]HAU31710.1 cell division protein SepF [Desulfotomaculum sp.]